jgi:hypothetical protein
VPMMRVGEVRMRVRHRLVPVSMSVARCGFYADMLVLMMCVVLVLMLMLQRLVPMHVLVAFSQMQPHTACHQESGDYQQRCKRLV